MRLAARTVALVAMCVACKPREQSSTPPAHAPAEQVALSGAALLVGAGDIGVCGRSGDEQTAALMDSVLKADSAAGVPAVAFTVGDNAYPAGLDRDFVRCFGSSWGDRKKRIINVIRPAIGNHDYQSDRGAAYYRYFGARSGPAYKGYYSYDIGEWHAIVINSEMIVYGSRAARDEQYEWIRNDLRSRSRACTVAYFHKPRFSSGAHGGSSSMGDLWEILAKSGVDLVLNGHEHHYERFAPMNAAGVLDTLNGMEEIIVGTGGGELTGIRSTVARNSVIRIPGHWGILIAALGSGEYRTSFLDVSGVVRDASGRKCH